MCGRYEWALFDSVWELREYTGGGLVIGVGQVLPVIALMCNHGGYTHLVNAIAAGAVAKPTKEANRDA
jgi:hypothetical protein